MNKRRRFRRSALESSCRRTWFVLSVGSGWLRDSRTSRFGWSSPGSFDAGRTDASFPLRRWTRSASGFTALPAMSRIARILGPSFGENYPTIQFDWIIGLVGVIRSDDEVELAFVDRSGRESRVTADVAVGADGIHSVVRDHVVPTIEPRFSGLCAFRCLVPAADAPEMARRPVQTLWLGPGRHFVHYPISRGQLVNVVAIAPAGNWRTESWTDDGEVSDLLREFETWDGRLRQLIVSATETKRWALYDREPLERWTKGRITLLGDAAHAMLPFLAQGAAQATEDAAVLADCLEPADEHSVEEALQRYEDLRRPRANRILIGSRGREIRNHLPDGLEQRRRDEELAAGDPLRQSAWLYG